MSPLPPAGQVAPPHPTQVHVTLPHSAGNVSATLAPLAALGPALVATIVQVEAPPATIVAIPSVLLIERSALAPSASVSVALLLPGWCR
jgi:hypothetical protein